VLFQKIPLTLQCPNCKNLPHLW